MIYLAVLVALLTIWGGSLALQRAAGDRSDVWGNEYSWFAALWVASFALHLLPLFSYRFPLSVGTGVFVVAANLAMAAGIAVATTLRSPIPPKPDTSHLVLSRSILSAILFAGALAQLVLSLNNLLGSGISIGARLNATGFVAARLQQFEFDPYFLGPLWGPISLLASLCYVGVACYAFAWGLREPWARRLSRESLLMGLVVLIVAANQLFIAAGRVALIYLAIVMLVPAGMGSALLSDITGRPRRRVPLVVVAPTILALTIGSAAFQQFRGGENDPIQVMAGIHGVFVGPAVPASVQQNKFLGYYMLQSTYLTVPPHMLGVTVDLPAYDRPGPFAGQYNFHVIYRQFARFSPHYDPQFWEAARSEIFRPYVRLGMAKGNVWASLLRDLTADFGLLGTCVVLFLFGLAVQANADSYRRQPTATRAALTAVFRLIALFSALFSVLFVAWVEWSIVILAVLIALSVRPQPSKISAPRRA